MNPVYQQLAWSRSPKVKRIILSDLRPMTFYYCFIVSMAQLSRIETMFSCKWPWSNNRIFHHRRWIPWPRKHSHKNYFQTFKFSNGKAKIKGVVPTPWVVFGWQNTLGVSGLIYIENKLPLLVYCDLSLIDYYKIVILLDSQLDNAW